MKKLTAIDFKNLLVNKDFFLLDIRFFGGKKIVGTDAWIRCDDMKDCLEKLPLDKSRKIVVYCGYGRTSLRACELLLELGYTDLANLEGGFAAYCNLT